MCIIIAGNCGDENSKQRIIDIYKEQGIDLEIICQIKPKKEPSIHLDKEIIEKVDEFFKNCSVSENDRNLVKMLMQVASTHRSIEEVYEIVSEELDLYTRAIKLKLVNIKNLMGWEYIHPDDFLKRIMADMEIV